VAEGDELAGDLAARRQEISPAAGPCGPVEQHRASALDAACRASSTAGDGRRPNRSRRSPKRLGASPRPGWPVGKKLTATVEYDWAECLRQNCRVLPPMQCSSAFEVGLAGEHHEDSEARVERRLARSARHARAGIMGLPRQAGRRARNPPNGSAGEAPCHFGFGIRQLPAPD
jgi:hypothetical protein